MTKKHASKRPVGRPLHGSKPKVYVGVRIDADVAGEMNRVTDASGKPLSAEAEAAFRLYASKAARFFKGPPPAITFAPIVIVEDHDNGGLLFRPCFCCQACGEVIKDLDTATLVFKPGVLNETWVVHKTYACSNRPAHRRLTHETCWQPLADAWKWMGINGGQK